MSHKAKPNYKLIKKQKSREFCIHQLVNSRCSKLRTICFSVTHFFKLDLFSINLFTDLFSRVVNNIYTDMRTLLYQSQCAFPQSF